MTQHPRRQRWASLVPGTPSSSWKHEQPMTSWSKLICRLITRHRRRVVVTFIEWFMIVFYRCIYVHATHYYNTHRVNTAIQRKITAHYSVYISGTFLFNSTAGHYFTLIEYLNIIWLKYNYYRDSAYIIFDCF